MLKRCAGVKSCTTADVSRPLSSDPPCSRLRAGNQLQDVHMQQALLQSGSTHCRSSCSSAGTHSMMSENRPGWPSTASWAMYCNREQASAVLRTETALRPHMCFACSTVLVRPLTALDHAGSLHLLHTRHPLQMLQDGHFLQTRGITPRHPQRQLVDPLAFLPPPSPVTWNLEVI